MSETGDNDSNDAINFSDRLPSTRSNDSDDDNMLNMEVRSSSTRADSSLSMTDCGDAEMIDDNTSNPVDENDHEMLCDSMCNVANESSMDEFVMQKMQDRPPCYDDIENDRIASPIADCYNEAPIADCYDEAPIADCYDEAPTADNYDEPPPMYDAIHYAHPCTLQEGTLNPSSSLSNEVVRPNYSTVTEVPIMTTEVAIRRANEENTIHAECFYTNCALPRRNYLIYSTANEVPRVATAETVTSRTNDETTPTDPNGMLQLLQQIRSIRMSLTEEFTNEINLRQNRST